MIWSPGAVLWVAWCLTTSSVFYNFFEKIHRTQILTKTVLFTWSLNMWNCWFKSTMLFRKKNRALPIGIKPIASHCLNIFWHGNQIIFTYFIFLSSCLVFSKSLGQFFADVSENLTSLRYPFPTSFYKCNQYHIIISFLSTLSKIKIIEMTERLWNYRFY